MSNKFERKEAWSKDTAYYLTRAAMNQRAIKMGDADGDHELEAVLYRCLHDHVFHAYATTKAIDCKAMAAQLFNQYNQGSHHE